MNLSEKNNHFKQLIQLKVGVGPESENRNCLESELESDDETSDSTALIPTPRYSYGLLQLYKPYSTAKTGIRTHTTAWPAKCKVCTTRQTQSHTHTATLSHLIHYTGRNPHTGDQIFKNGQKSQTANPKIVRPTRLKYGQISEIWPQNGQSGNPWCRPFPAPNSFL